MSIILPAVDLTGVLAGNTGNVSLKATGYTSDPSHFTNPAHIQLFNESGAGLQITALIGQQSVYIPAGAWRQMALSPGESQISYYVVYTLPNPPVSQLLIVYYAPNEIPDSLGSLGNSPIGIGGNVQVSTAQSLQNDGNLGGTQFIESTPSGASASTVSVDNNGNMTIKGNNAGTLTTLIQAVAGASPTLKLVAASVLAEVLGNLKVDGTNSIVGTSSFDNGALTTNGSGSFNTNVGVTAGNKINCNEMDSLAATDLVLNAPTSHSVSFKINGTEQSRVGAGGLLNETGKLGKTTDGDLIDASGASDVYFKAFGGNINFQSPSGTLLAQLLQSNKSLALNSNQGNLVGTTNGNIFYWQPFTGSAFKLFMCQASNYNNTSATRQAITLPVAFGACVGWFCNGFLNPVNTTRGFYLKLSGVQQQGNMFTGNGAITTNTGPFPSASMGGLNTTSGFDTIEFDGSLSGNGSGILVLIGA